MKISSNVPVEKISNVQKIDLQLKEKENKSKSDDIEKKEVERQSTNYSLTDLNEMVKGMNSFLKPANTSVHFRLHNELNRYFVELVDKDTDEVIKEIPSEKLLDLYANMLESIGLLVDQKI